MPQKPCMFRNTCCSALHRATRLIPFVLVYLCEILFTLHLVCFVGGKVHCVSAAPRRRTMRARGVSMVTQLDSAIRSRRSITRPWRSPVVWSVARAPTKRLWPALLQLHSPTLLLCPETSAAPCGAHSRRRRSGSPLVEASEEELRGVRFRTGK